LSAVKSLRFSREIITLRLVATSVYLRSSLNIAPTEKRKMPVQPKPKREGYEAIEAWITYRDLGPSRSVQKAANALDKSMGTLQRWAIYYKWVQRADEWDAKQREIVDAAILEEKRNIGKLIARQDTDMIRVLNAGMNAVFKQYFNEDGTLKAGQTAPLDEMYRMISQYLQARGTIFKGDLSESKPRELSQEAVDAAAEMLPEAERPEFYKAVRYMMVLQAAMLR
jgi:hypothetical protein